MKAAAVQLQMSDDRDANLGQAGELIDLAAADGATVVLMPELFAAPFVQPEPDPDYFAWAEQLDGPSNSLAAERSARHRITVVSSVFEQTAMPGVYANTACTFVEGRLAQVYRKSHLPFSNGFPEKFYFRPGDQPPTAVDAGPARIGTIICYERHFPELSRAVALDGGILLCVPVASASAPMREVFQLELRAHAVFNAMYVLCSNRVGTEGDKTYFGTSAVYGPSGETLAEVGDQEPGVALAEVDPSLVARIRRTRPVFRDRRPELYGALVAEDPMPGEA